MNPLSSDHLFSSASQKSGNAPVEPSLSAGFPPVHLIVGGCRSGKSRHAQELTEAAAPRRIYLATCVPLDEEMEYRVRRHQEDRDDSWITVEEPLDLPARLAALNAALDADDENDRDSLAGPRTALLVDCLTLWTSNLLFDSACAPAETHGTESSPSDPNLPFPPLENSGSPIEPQIPEIRESPEAAARRLETRFADLIRVLKEMRMPVFLVSNETGCGIVPGDALSRLFRDMTGRLNQLAAAAAAEVTWMVAGIPVKIKSSRLASEPAGAERNETGPDTDKNPVPPCDSKGIQ